MRTKTKTLNTATTTIPVTLSQIAAGLRKLSPGELETLELLLDKEAMRVIDRSAREAKRGKARELLSGA